MLNQFQSPIFLNNQLKEIKDGVAMKEEDEEDDDDDDDDDVDDDDVEEENGFETDSDVDTADEGTRLLL